MMSVPATGTYFIYAFDGRLLAEYDVAGQLVREYIYFSGQLVAEYRNQDSRLLYYASDQINSTRIVTDNTGSVVYAAAHEPYGEIQKIWISSYEPSLKFSGQNHDAESDFDYFGGRYYDKSTFRFLSVDPAFISKYQRHDHMSLNLYAYCGNNPVNYLDPDGREMVRVFFSCWYFVKFFLPYLQSDMAAKYKLVQDWGDSNGLQIVVTDAFRTANLHKSLSVENKDSMHKMGLAFDISLEALGKENFDALKKFCDDNGMTAEIHGNHIHIYFKDSKYDADKAKQAENEVNRLMRDPFFDLLRAVQFFRESFFWFMWGSVVPPDTDI